MKLKFIKTFTAAAVVCCLTVTSQATLLVPGGNAVPALEPAGPAAIATLVQPFASGPLTGTVTSWVVQGDPSNPYVSGPLGHDPNALSFYYQVFVTGDYVNRFTPGGYANVDTQFGVDVNYITAAWDGAIAGGLVPPAASTRSTMGLDNGDEVAFNAPSPLTAGNWSPVLVVGTSWDTWTSDNAAVIDTYSANVQVLTPVPEPTTMIAGALLLLPFGASTLRILRRRTA